MKTNNKDIYNNYNEIYDKILHDKNDINDDEIRYMSSQISVIRPKYKSEIRKIIKFYSNMYPTESLNWLDVSEIINMSELFMETDYNGDISHWDVSNAMNMSYMFWRTKFNGDISRWNMSKVKTMSWMFANSKFNCDISNWNVYNVDNMSCMFYNSIFNHDISNWNINKIDYTKYSNIFIYSNIKDEFKPKIKT